MSSDFLLYTRTIDSFHESSDYCTVPMLAENVDVPAEIINLLNNSARWFLVGVNIFGFDYWFAITQWAENDRPVDRGEVVGFLNTGTETRQVFSEVYRPNYTEIGQKLNYQYDLADTELTTSEVLNIQHQIENQLFGEWYNGWKTRLVSQS